VIDIYITHHAPLEIAALDDVLVEEVHWIRHVTPPGFRVTIIAWPEESVARLRDRLPHDVAVVANDRPGRADCQPSMRNKVIDLALARPDCEAIVLLHNDVRPARGWLGHLVADWRVAEARWGRDRCVVAPRYIPYHLVEPLLSISIYPEIWDLLRSTRPSWEAIKTTDEMIAWCAKHGFLFDQDRREVICPPNSEVTDDGHQIMMFIASPHFFDVVGPCDETMTGSNYDDSDWGIRALLAGKKNLQSTGALVAHAQGLTFSLPAVQRRPPAISNADVFVAKWGRPIFDEMQTGQLWPRLHREQEA